MPLTVTVLLDRWLDALAQRDDLSPATQVTYRRVAAHLRDLAASQEVERLDLRRYAAARASAHLSPRTLELELRVVRIAVNWAVREGLLPALPAIRMPKLRIERAEYRCNHRTPTTADVRAVLARMPADDWRLALHLLACTGARVGEVVRLVHADLDVPSAQLALGRHEGARKTGLRWFPVDAPTLRVLAARDDAPEAPLLRFGPVAAPIQGLLRRLAQACRLARVPRFTPHGLRRMVVSRLLRAGIAPGIAASLTGHSIAVMLRYYQQVTDDDRRVAVDRAQVWRLDRP